SARLIFTGNPPSAGGKLIVNDSFTYSAVFAEYPHSNPAWTETVRQSLGDNIIWIPDNYDTSVKDTPRDKTEALTPASSDNKGDNEYINTRYWADKVNSYLVDNDDGTFTRVEHIGNSVVVEDYDSSFKIKWKKTIDKELPLYGGFYSGTDYNFFVFGQENLEENNSKPVVRIVRYSKNWHRIDSTELCGANTIRPFHAGTLRMTEKDDTLFIHTCHQIYTMDDGLNHQTNMFIAVSIPYMKIVAANYHVGGVGYVSHSFNQFIIADGDSIVWLDHGDAYPRAVTITRFTGLGSNEENADVLPICGEEGNNRTGVSVGGFEASGTCYLVAGNTVVQDEKSYKPSGTRNVFITATDKSRMSDADSTVFRWITNYTDSDKITVSNPLLTKIESDRFLLMWTETDGNRNSVMLHVFLDGEGNPTSAISQSNYPMSDCQPIVAGNRVIWYVTENSAPRFFSINLDGTTSYPKGDVNRDGIVSNSDLILAARHVVSLTTLTGEQFTLGDMNNDGAITNTDIITIARKIVGLY
ncbi:MAG: dockerin type I repeat-containing protein, partial [Oscillospiraceae bacterium]|nr:dockerin type I repeat-containing protein [Oscillospiraceae bacterium]